MQCIVTKLQIYTFCCTDMTTKLPFYLKRVTL